MKRIAVIGAKGYIGSTLYATLVHNKSLEVTSVTRDNYEKCKQEQFDIVINAAMPAARFWAKNNPEDDFIETVKKTADIVYGWQYKKIIQISTISARTERDTIYGRHKASAEVLCDFGDNFIVRLTATYANTLTKGALVDFLANRKIFVNKKSRYSFARLEFVCNWIANNLDKHGLQEVGARNAISLEEIAASLHHPIICEGRTDHQEVANPLPEFPDAKDVIAFLGEKLKVIS